MILDSGICALLRRQTAVMMRTVLLGLVKQVCFLFVCLFLFFRQDSSGLMLFYASIAGVLDIKVMGCLATEECNRTTVVEFLSNKTLYSIKKSCCDNDFCNACSALQFSLAPLSLTILLIATMIGLF